MTLEDARHLLNEPRCYARGVDLIVPHSISWSWKDLQHVAAVLGTEAIDIGDRDQYDTLPVFSTISGRYEYEGGGCPSCGYGSEIVVRGILDQST